MRSLQNENGRCDTQDSAPNTPDSMRRRNNLQRHSSSTSMTSSPILQRSGSEKIVNMKGQMTSTTPLPLKKEKMEFNERMMRMGSVDGMRPVSYHGKSHSALDTSLGMNMLTSPAPLALSPLVLRKRSAGQGPSPVKIRSKDANILNRRSMPVGTILENRLRDKFDLSDLDTNLPRIDLEAIETHLRLAGEEDRKQRRSDRDEIRRRLALESDEMVEKSGGRKPSLHSRLQSSMNLQICFMNETASDSESPGSDTEAKNNQQPGSLPFINSKVTLDGNGGEDFYVRQAKLQADARQALSQAKDLARIQMSHEKEKRRYSPITEIVRNSLQKVGMNLSPERRRLSRQLLTEMNVAQLQIIVNDLHNHIEDLNEKLVSMLLDRDELHMEQDSMLVDIEDLSRYLAAKETSPHQSLPLIPPPKSLLLGRK